MRYVLLALVTVGCASTPPLAERHATEQRRQSQLKADYEARERQQREQDAKLAYFLEACKGAAMTPGKWPDIDRACAEYQVRQEMAREASRRQHEQEMAAIQLETARIQARTAEKQADMANAAAWGQVMQNIAPAPVAQPAYVPPPPPRPANCTTTAIAGTAYTNCY
jgi:hypothetical protein